MENKGIKERRPASFGSWHTIMHMDMHMERDRRPVSDQRNRAVGNGNVQHRAQLVGGKR
ncbi:hypothetical protein TUM17560_26330 [Serratia marcescens]|nr:hypothetical protein TUM17560_26330 [Serratia marcescens]